MSRQAAATIITSSPRNGSSKAPWMISADHDHQQMKMAKSGTSLPASAISGLPPAQRSQVRDGCGARTRFRPHSRWRSR